MHLSSFLVVAQHQLAVLQFDDAALIAGMVRVIDHQDVFNIVNHTYSLKSLNCTDNATP
jgi:hypothetical protein